MASRLYVVAKIPKTVYDERVRNIKLLFTFVLVFLIFFTFTKNVFAEITFTYTPSPVYQDSRSITIKLRSDINNTFQAGDYTFGFWEPGKDASEKFGPGIVWQEIVSPTTDKTLEATLELKGDKTKKGLWTFKVWKGKALQSFEDKNMIFPFGSTRTEGGHYYIYPSVGSAQGIPSLEILSPVQSNTTQTLTIVNIDPQQDYTIYFDGSKSTIQAGRFPPETISEEKRGGKQFKVAKIEINSGEPSIQKRICLRQGKPFAIFGLNCDFSVTFQVTVLPPSATPFIKTGNQAGIPTLIPEPTYDTPPPPCAEFKDGKCIAVDTAIGRISTEPQGFVKRIFSLVLGIAGGIALILIILSGYKMMASQGNPEQINAARDQLLSAIIGLLFIIFSFVILQVIGVDILKIPGFKP